MEASTVKRTGSGVAIASRTTKEGEESFIVTNAHVADLDGLKDARVQVIVEAQGKEMRYLAEPLALGALPDLDLALMRIRGVQLLPADLAKDDEVEIGDPILVAAAPFGKALSVAGGMVSQLERAEGQRPVRLKTDAPVGYGSSGGGIYSLATGKLVAIVEGYRTAKVGFSILDNEYSFDVPMPGETFAAPTAKLRSFLKAKGFGGLL
jgi:S1-C subfamily serine protease